MKSSRKISEEVLINHELIFENLRTFEQLDKDQFLAERGDVEEEINQKFSESNIKHVYGPSLLAIKP